MAMPLLETIVFILDSYDVLRSKNQLSQNNLQQQLIIVVHLRNKMLLVLISHKFRWKS